MTLRFSIALSLFLAPSLAVAVGFNEDDTPPKPTETTEVCEDGQVWDGEASACVDPDDTALNDVLRLKAIRELAYAGRTEDALRVLDTVEDAASDGAMTYRGFLARQGGDWEAAQAYYAEALTLNPDNLMARSYLGQGYIKAGNAAAAQEQLSEIRARGGRQSWAEISLRLAISSGTTPAY